MTNTILPSDLTVRPEYPEMPATTDLLLLPTPPQSKRRTNLKAIDDVRVEMARIYRMVDADRMPSHEGTKRIFMLAQIGKVIEVAGIEARLDKLEAKVVARHGK
jgi:hypothetical protein